MLTQRTIAIDVTVVENGKKVIPVELLPTYVQVAASKAITALIEDLHAQGFISIRERDEMLETYSTSSSLVQE